MGMSGTELLQAVRDLLNEPVAGFWTDAQLYRYISRSYERWMNIMGESAPSGYTVSETVSYTGGEAAVTSTIGATGVQWNARVKSVRDITDGWPGDELIPASGLNEIIGLQDYSGAPTHYFIYFTVEEVSGSDKPLRSLVLGPKPADTRQIFINGTATIGKTDIDSTFTDTLLPPEVDRCVYIDAARMAARQDKDYQLVSQLDSDLREARREMMIAKTLLGETESVVYDYDD